MGYSGRSCASPPAWPMGSRPDLPLEWGCQSQSHRGGGGDAAHVQRYQKYLSKVLAAAGPPASMRPWPGWFVAGRSPR